MVDLSQGPGSTEGGGYKDVCERTIDRRLRDRIRIDIAFSSYLLTRVGAAEIADASCAGCEVGVWRASGETDIEARFADPGGGVSTLWIENKISAPFMPQQLERYLADATVMGHRTVVAVLAPMGYLRRAVIPSGVVQVSYEEVKSWLEEHAATEASRALDAYLLGRGIEKEGDPATRSGVIISHSSSEALYAGMFLICREDFTLPPLKEKTSTSSSASGGVRSEGSYELCFDLPGWQKLIVSPKARRYFALNYRFDLDRSGSPVRTRHGQPADIQIELAFWRHGVDIFKRRLPRFPFPSHWSIDLRKADALFLVRGVGVPRLDRNRPLSEQRDAFDAALVVLREAFAWYERSYPELVACAQEIEASLS